MKLIVLLGLFSVLLKLKAEDELNCHVDGISDSAWGIMGMVMEPPINDTHEGLIASFTTANIQAINVVNKSSDKYSYMNASFENNILTIFTTEQFKDFEKNMKGLSEIRTSIEITCYCTNKEKRTLILHEDVIDINNHLPIFEQTRYEYNFGMKIPLDFELTMFQDIRASDDDFTNKDITFTTDSEEINNNFKIDKKTMIDSKYYYTTLKALTNIFPPFKQEFIMVATDSGNPPSSSNVTVVINVNAPENGSSENSTEHPPVFSKHLYVANYTLENTLIMEENITMKYGAKENMTVRQKGYEEFFKIVQNSLVKEEFDVQILEPLTEDILKNDYIIIDVEVKTEGSQYEGLATLIINLPQTKNDSNNDVHPPVFSKTIYFANYTSNHELKMNETITIKYGATNKTIIKQFGYEEYINVTLNKLNTTELKVEIIKPLNNKTLESDLILIGISAENEGLSIPTRTNLIIQLEKGYQSDCHNVVHIFGYSVNNTLLPLILFLSAITMIVFINVVVLSLYFKHNKLRSVA